MATYENEQGGKTNVFNVAHSKSREIHYIYNPISMNL